MNTNEPTEKRIVGEWYDCDVLVDHATGKPMRYQFTKDTKEIENVARDDAQRLLRALADPTGMTMI